MRRFLVAVVTAVAALIGLGLTASSASAATIGVVVNPGGSATAGQGLMYAKQHYAVLEPDATNGSTTLLGVVVEASGKAGDSVTVTGSSFRVASG